MPKIRLLIMNNYFYYRLILFLLYIGFIYSPEVFATVLNHHSRDLPSSVSVRLLDEDQFADFPVVMLHQTPASVLMLTQSVLNSAAVKLEQYDDPAKTALFLKHYGIQPDTMGIILFYVDAGYITCSSRLHQLMQHMMMESREYQ